jgi:hypothetical protein
MATIHLLVFMLLSLKTIGGVLLKLNLGITYFLGLALYFHEAS